MTFDSDHKEIYFPASYCVCVCVWDSEFHIHITHCVCSLYMCAQVCVLIYLPPGVKVSQCPKVFFYFGIRDSSGFFGTAINRVIHIAALTLHAHTPTDTHCANSCITSTVFWCVICAVCNLGVHRCCLWVSTMSIFLFSGGEKSSLTDSRGHHTCFYLVLWQACTFKILRMRPVEEWD